MDELVIPDWTLGWRLKRSLAQAGIQTVEMADELGVSRTTVSGWLNDRGAPPRIGFMKLWAMRTGVPLEWLVNGAADPVPARGDLFKRFTIPGSRPTLGAAA